MRNNKNVNVKNQAISLFGLFPLLIDHKKYTQEKI